MDNEDKTITPDEIEETPPTPETPKTTVQGFLHGLGSLVSDIRKQYRMSENGALRLVQFGLEYDMNRRQMSREENVGEASDK